MDHVPAQGPALIVANHSGVLPWDGVMINLAVRHEHPARRECRMLALDMFALLPFLAPLLAQCGAVRANQENGERLLRKGELVGVFPEGVKGVGKPFKERYRLARFGRGGFVRLALRTGAPIVPCAVVGAEEIQARTCPACIRHSRPLRMVVAQGELEHRAVVGEDAGMVGDEEGGTLRGHVLDAQRLHPPPVENTGTRTTGSMVSAKKAGRSRIRRSSWSARRSRGRLQPAQGLPAQGAPA